MTSVQHHQIRTLALMAIFTAILFVQQLALSFLPNIQFTTLLIILYTKLLGFKKTTLIITVHVIAINLFSPLGPVIPVYLPAMWLGWMVIPFFLTSIFKHMDQALHLALFGLVHGFVYGWIFAPFAAFVIAVPLWTYLLMDLPFEIIMAVSNFITIYWLYDLMKKALQRQLERLYMTE